MIPARPLRILVADDEAPARRRLLDLLARQPEPIARREATDGRETVEAIVEWEPDLVFLDVQMPELDGFGVIDAIGAAALPLTVFVTAFDRHAIQAFEANALDYLLKPFSDERFEMTMARALARLEPREDRQFTERLRRLLEPPAGRAPLDRLVIKSGGSTRFLPAAEIEWIEAAGVYVTLHTGGREILHRASLTDLETRLDPRRFVRIHRSAIVNLECVVQLDPMTHGEFDLVLRSGARVRLSRTYRAQFEQRLGQPL